MLVRLNAFFDLQKRGWKVVEVGEEIRVDGEVVVLVHNLDFDGIGEVHSCGLFDVDDRRVWEGDLDALAMVLRFKNDFLDRLDPFVSTRDRICLKMEGLLIRPQLEVALANSFARDSVTKVHVSMRKVGVLSRTGWRSAARPKMKEYDQTYRSRRIPRQDIVLENIPVLRPALRP